MELISVVHENLTTKAAWGQRPSWLFGVLRMFIFGQHIPVSDPLSSRKLDDFFFAILI